MAVRRFIRFRTFERAEDIIAWCEREGVGDVVVYRHEDGLFRGSAELPEGCHVKSSAESVEPKS